MTPRPSTKQGPQSRSLVSMKLGEGHSIRTKKKRRGVRCHKVSAILRNIGTMVNIVKAILAKRIYYHEAK
ncbi:MAG: hypothetical protein Nkreftii_002754 [Candidatus Nitrospira kreftii]|uniref:Uncharacterized protein n=1 Tax=Candidatus Nitrospira kreftii TaxID=2652173 RepID=A0A7S8J0G9_9BACT|nr:MAG: hypothetical protein Nkreftii_002754 [Candidatus Nitrospira kreftii]